MRIAMAMVLVGLISLGVGTSSAQSTFSAARPAEQRVICESRGLARQQCGADLRGYVFSRVIDGAGSRCEVGRNFGYSDTALWIEQGCGGSFYFSNRNEPLAGAPAAGNDKSLRCESQDGRRASCPADLSAYALLDVRQLSRTNCIDGQNWSWDDRGVTVDQGCRADFVFARRTDQQLAGGAAPRTMNCASRDGRRADCPMDLSGYTMRSFRQVSRSACESGRTFGVTEGGVWADQGCRVEIIFDYVGNRGRGYATSTAISSLPAVQSQPVGSVPTTVRCESVDNARNYCDAAFAVRARVQQQLSRSTCTEGVSWGLDRRGLWVDRGCRADFEVFR